jgi:signal transduction histidine kinase
LSICRSIVWDMGGEIRFESMIGKGTKVLLTLPSAGDA